MVRSDRKEKVKENRNNDEKKRKGGGDKWDKGMRQKGNSKMLRKEEGKNKHNKSVAKEPKRPRECIKRSKKNPIKKKKKQK